MTARLIRHKGMIIIAIIVVLVLFGWLYRELHPTIVFHSPQESKYLGKVSGTDGSIEKLYIKDRDVIHKEDLCFWKLDVYLDEDNCCLNRRTTEYCYGLRRILQSKTDK